MRELNGRVAFITGGGSGIGLGIAMACVNSGMKVVLADLRRDHLEDALAHFGNQGQERSVHAIELDVTDRRAYEAAASEAERVFGKTHLLCNNAGIGIAGPFKQCTYADWDWGLGVMLGGVVNGVTTWLPRILKHSEGGHIVNTASTAGVIVVPNCSIYNTAKAAVIALSETLRSELAPDGIGVSAFCPGPVLTAIGESSRLRPEKYKKESGLLAYEEERRERMAAALRSGPPPWMRIEECGERVLRGVQRNDLYIFTHREFKEGVAERMEAMLRSFPDEAVNETRAKEIPYLTSNPVFKEAIKSARGV
jgi:NAD(P)-dependent dehydrogenase (short-subunit alcohol dehydrogenase family)